MCSCSSWMRARSLVACSSRSAGDPCSRSTTLTVSKTPLIGRRGRCFLRSARNPVQPMASAWRSLSWVVNRPAVSSSTASSVNHQSQLRVPPTPRTDSLPRRSASGKLSPEFRSAVVFPDPGAPMITYHGSSYTYCRPARAPSAERRDRPIFARFRTPIASAKRLLSSATCSAPGLGAAASLAGAGRTRPSISCLFDSAARTPFATSFPT